MQCWSFSSPRQPYKQNIIYFFCHAISFLVGWSDRREWSFRDKIVMKNRLFDLDWEQEFPFFCCLWGFPCQWQSEARSRTTEGCRQGNKLEKKKWKWRWKSIHFFSIGFLSKVKYETIWLFTERLYCPCRTMTHTRHFILQPQPEGTWGVRGGECFSCAAQAAAGSRLLTMFCYLQAAVADFSFQHLALLLFAGCLVPKGKLWWLVLGGAAGHKTPASRSIPVPPFPPTHMGLSALWTGCGTAGRCLQPSVSAWSRCLLSLLDRKSVV